MTRHVKELDGFRGLLALWVLLVHVCYLAGLDRLMRALHADVAVELFIILSGFVIFNLLQRGETYADFITRRFFRLFPAYLVALSLCVLLSEFAVAPNTEPFRRTFHVGNNDQLGAYLLSHLTLLHGALPEQQLSRSATAYLPPAWSISLEWQFYLLAPFLFAYLKRPTLRYALLVLVLFVVRAIYIAQGHGFEFLPHMSFGHFEAFLPLRIELFFIGGGCFLVWHHLTMREIRLNLRADWLALLVVPLVYFLTKRLSVTIWSAVFLLLVAYRFWQPVLLAKAACRTLSHGSLEWLGTVSYSLYILHWPVLVITHGFLDRAFPEAGIYTQASLLAVFGLPLSLSVAAVNYPLVEKPCMDYARRLTQRGKLVVARQEAG